MSDEAAAWARARIVFRALCDLPAAVRDARLAALRDEDAAFAEHVAALLDQDRRDGTTLTRAVHALHAEIRDARTPLVTGPWQLEQLIGTGGMGEVWQARRVGEDFEQHAALKLVRRGMDSAALLERFRQERRILARLEHPAIARLLDGGIASDGRPYLVMERVDGEPIDAWVARHRPPLDVLLGLFVKICGAVDHAHRNLIVHRDLKPSNVMIDADGQPRLLDFGIAKLLDDDSDPAAQTQLRALTPAYAAPEQFSGDPVTTATDVHALGLLLYEAIAGALPRERRAVDAAGGRREDVLTGPVQALWRDSSADPVRRRRLQAIRPLQRDLDAIVLTALRHDPARRYPTAAALADDLRRLLDGRPVSARGDSLGYRVHRLLRRHRTAVAAVALAVFTLLAGAGTAIWQARRVHEAAADMRLAMQRAEAESHRAEAARDFLFALLESANPGHAGGDARRTVLEVLQSADARVEESLRGQPLAQAELRILLALALRGHGDHALAFELVQKALAVLDDGSEADLRELAVALHTRGSMRAARGELEAAEQDVQRALALFSRMPDDPALRVRRRAANTTLAMIYSTTGREIEALALRRRDLEERSADFDEHHPELATAWYNLAVSSLNAERYRDALHALRRTEAIMQPQGDVASSRQVNLWLALASALASTGRFDEAQGYLARASALLDGDFGASQPVMRTTQRFMATHAAVLAGEFDRAETIGALLWDDVQAGERSTDPSMQLVPWITLLLARGRADEAMPAITRALTESRHRRGDDHPVTLHLEAAQAYATHLQHGDADSIDALARLTERLRAAPTRRQFAQAGAWLASLLPGSDPRAVPLAADVDAALVELYGAEHPWRRSRAGTRTLADR